MVKRAELLTTTLRCGDWHVPMAEFHILQLNAEMCLFLGADLMPFVGLELTQSNPPKPRDEDNNPGKYKVRSVVPDQSLN